MARVFQCPYYKWTGGLRVFCESGRTDFTSKQALRDFVCRYCGSDPGWKSCTMAQRLNREYERGQRN